jgi:hypothetical protein
MDFESWCVPSAIHDATVFRGNGYRVRIAIYKLSTNPNKDHSQAEAEIGNVWTPLTSHRHGPGGVKIVETWDRHYPDKEVYRYVDLDTFIEEQMEINRGKVK